MLCRFLPSFRNAIMALFVLLYHERVVCHNLTLSISHSYIFFLSCKRNFDWETRQWKFLWNCHWRFCRPPCEKKNKWLNMLDLWLMGSEAFRKSRLWFTCSMCTLRSAWRKKSMIVVVILRFKLQKFDIYLASSFLA